ncbi:MAG: hypothetical protein CSYNP_02716 [Syntrophus sp. SKADARSKE-3]|nr:hypothetical protein [Syntrophus sp. SKADARSKE-3]
MRKIGIISSFVAVIFLLISLSVYAAPSSSCINCHTNDAIMKALCKVPVLPAGEGEG